MKKHTQRARRRRSPFGQFVNHVSVTPTCTEITLAMGHFHAETSDQANEWGADEIARFTLPYAAAKVAAFNLLACLTAVEFKGGHVGVPAGIQPEMPAAEYLGPDGAARLATLFAELFPQPASPSQLPAATTAPAPSGGARPGKIH